MISKRISENWTGDIPSLYIYTLAQWASGVLKTGENPRTPFTTAQRGTSEVVYSAPVSPMRRDGIGTASVIGRYLFSGSLPERIPHQTASRHRIRYLRVNHSGPHKEVPVHQFFLLDHESRLPQHQNRSANGIRGVPCVTLFHRSSPLPLRTDVVPDENCHRIGR